MRWILLVVLVSACGSADSRKRHEAAGKPFRHCRKHAAPPENATSTYHRGTWSTAIKQGATPLGSVRIESTYRTTDGFPDAVETCLDVQNVNPDVAITADMTALNFGDDRATAHVLIGLHLVVIGPARVEDGRTLNHPQARLAWDIKARGSSMEATAKDAADDREFRPSWNTGPLATDDAKVQVEAIAKPAP